MFYAMERWQKTVVSVMLFIAGYFLFTVIFGLGDLILAPTPITLLGILPRLWGVKLLICGALVMAMVSKTSLQPGTRFFTALERSPWVFTA